MQLRTRICLVGATFALLVAPAAASATTMSYDSPGARVTLVRSGADLRLVDDATATVLATGALDQLTQVAVHGARGVDDTLTVDLSGGSFAVPVSFDGGAGGFDTLRLRGGSAAAESHSATGPQSGTITADAVHIDYSGIEPVNDTVPVTNFTFSAPAGSTRIALDDGANPADGILRIHDAGSGAFEEIRFSNKMNVTINGSTSGTDFDLLNNENATGLTTLQVNGATVEDSFRVRNTTATTSTTVNGLGSSDMFLLSHTGTPLTVNGGDRSDRYLVSFGGFGGAASIADNGALGIDELLVSCDPGVAVGPAAVTSGAQSVAYTGIEFAPPCPIPGTGPQGPQGSQGPQGPPGPRGPAAFRLVAVLHDSKLKARSGARVRVPYVSTAAATARLDVLKGSKRVARIRGKAKLGRNSLVWKGTIGGRPASAGKYTLKLQLRSTNGQTANDSAKLTIRR